MSLDTMKHKNLLMTILQDSRTNLLTTAVVCDAIAADARFNTWFVANRRSGNLDQMFELARDYERLTDRCSDAVTRLQEDGDDRVLRVAIEAFTNELLSIMAERFRS